MSERHVTVEIIIAAVSAVTDVSRIQIVGDRRDPDTVRARDAALWLASELVDVSKPMLARIFGDRDHTSILRAIERAQQRRREDRSFRIDTDAMFGTLKAIQQNGLFRLAETIDPLATARRILANPERESVRISSHEIVALCQIVAEAFADGANPSPELENSDAG